MVQGKSLNIKMVPKRAWGESGGAVRRRLDSKTVWVQRSSRYVLSIYYSIEISSNYMSFSLVLHPSFYHKKHVDSTIGLSDKDCKQEEWFAFC